MSNVYHPLDITKPFASAGLSPACSVTTSFVYLLDTHADGGCAETVDKLAHRPRTSNSTPVFQHIAFIFEILSGLLALSLNINSSFLLRLLGLFKCKFYLL